MCGAKEYGAGNVKSAIYRELQKLDHLKRKFQVGVVVMLLRCWLACRRTTPLIENLRFDRGPVLKLRFMPGCVCTRAEKGD